MRKLKKYKPTRFMAKTSHYDKDAADYAVMFIESLCHTKGTWAGRPFELIDWQERIIRDLFGVLKPNGYRQFNTAYIEIPKKMGKSELAAAVALLLCCGDGEERAEVYGRALSGELRILYVAPERLHAPDFADFSHRIRISLLAVDEAVAAAGPVVIGGGVRGSKLLVDGADLGRLPNAQVLRLTIGADA